MEDHKNWIGQSPASHSIVVVHGHGSIKECPDCDCEGTEPLRVDILVQSGEDTAHDDDKARDDKQKRDCVLYHFNDSQQ